MSEAFGVVGGGMMGSGIAEVAARSGCDVVVVEVDDAACDVARRNLSRSLDRAVDSGKLAGADRDAALGRVRITTDWDELVDRDIVVEAIVEDEELKRSVFRRLDELMSGDACVLASNTSSIPISRLAAATGRPDRVIGMHFFNPAPVLPLVEIIPSILTSSETVQRTREFAADRLGKQTVLATDRAGFVVNALLIPYLLAAIRMMEAGHATAEDIDRAMVAGCAHPMGPLALVDLIGLDTTAAVASSMYAEFKEPLYAPPPLLLRMVESGLLGRKTRRGFYPYR
jgi:3-hydroxybutyryl-CoA dehydrogenase